MSKYRDAFKKWQREWLQAELDKHHGNVRAMARANGLNRPHAYQLFASAGIKLGPYSVRVNVGNAAWHALSDEARS